MSLGYYFHNFVDNFVGLTLTDGVGYAGFKMIFQNNLVYL